MQGAGTAHLSIIIGHPRIAIAEFPPFCCLQVSAKLKLVRLECVESLIHNTLEHDNLVSLCFAPMLKCAWNLSLIREINANAAKTLRDLTVNFR